MNKTFEERAVDADTAKRLVSAQFPALAAFSIEPIESTGTDNHIFRIGEKLCLRFPKAPWAARSAEREVSVLSRLHELPLQVPRVFGLGAPGEDFPWQWSVMSWVPGEPVGLTDLEDMGYLAERLAEFVLAMRRQRIEPSCTAGEVNNYRGMPLKVRDGLFRDAVRDLSNKFNEVEMIRVWELCLAAPAAPQPLWLHGDIHGGNLLKQDGRLSGVIDWGLSGIGDCACDLSAAWVLFDEVDRSKFLDAMRASESEMLRGAGWALSIAAIFLAYNRNRDVSKAMSERTILRVLEEFA